MACTKRSLTLAAPRPDKHLHELGTAHAEERARGFLRPRPWQAGSCLSREDRRAERLSAFCLRAAVNLAGSFRNSITSTSSCLASSTPATSLKVTFELVLHVDFRLVLAQGHEAGLLAGHALHEEIPDPDERERWGRSRKRGPARTVDSIWPLKVTLCCSRRAGDLRVHPEGLEELSLVRILVISPHLALDLVGGDGDLGNPVLLDQGQKLAVGDGLDGKRGAKVASGSAERPRFRAAHTRWKTCDVFPLQTPVRGSGTRGDHASSLSLIILQASIIRWISRPLPQGL